MSGRFSTRSLAHGYSSMLYFAPLAIAYVATQGITFIPGPGLFWVAIENILLAAHAGLGAVWLGMYPIEQRVQALVNARLA
jgi:hypothetical protein